jgi:hypothetical protein
MLFMESRRMPSSLFLNEWMLFRLRVYIVVWTLGSSPLRTELHLGAHFLASLVHVQHRMN